MHREKLTIIRIFITIDRAHFIILIFGCLNKEPQESNRGHEMGCVSKLEIEAHGTHRLTSLFLWLLCRGAHLHILIYVLHVVEFAFKDALRSFHHIFVLFQSRACLCLRCALK